jgi:DNA helicase-2/ATP-dependent DNA helicase PcrA
MTNPICSECRSPMVARKGTYGPFYGCSGWRPGPHGCKKTLPRTIVDQSEIQQKLKRFEGFTWSGYQNGIFERIKQWQVQPSNLIVRAVAGSGKTTLLEYVACLLPTDASIVYAVYNAHVRDEALDRMPSHVRTLTTHQVGFAAIRNFCRKKVELDDKKVRRIVKGLIRNWELEGHLISIVCNVVSKLKNTLMQPGVDSVAYIVDRYGLEVDGSISRVAQLAKQALRQNNQQLGQIDFDDMIYLPVVLDMPVEQFDYVLGDEVQDWNRAQIELMTKAVKNTGLVLVVGDESQSIYGFRGADTAAMNRVQKLLKAEAMPLSITYRCSRSHVRLVNALFPTIPFEAAPDAGEGSVESVSEQLFLPEIRNTDGALVLCRTNAPLVKPVLDLLAEGIKAFIVGRNIGANLISLVQRFGTELVRDMLEMLADYVDIEAEKLVAADKELAAAMLIDKEEAIVALSDGCRLVSQVVQKIEHIFKDSKEEGRRFSTVHRAKGLEADTVFILQPKLIPHPMAKQDWERQQEDNIAYVAYTRAKSRLVFVGTIPETYVEGDMYSGSRDVVDAFAFAMQADVSRKELVDELLDGTTSVSNVVENALVEDVFVTGGDLKVLGFVQAPESPRSDVEDFIRSVDLLDVAVSRDEDLVPVIPDPPF